MPASRSPRQRRLSLANLAMSIPLPESAGNYSRPQSPTFYRSTLREIQSVLYGSLDKDEIRELIEQSYDGSASELNEITS